MKYWLITLATLDRGSLFWQYENVVFHSPDDPANYLADCFELDGTTVLTMQMEITEEQFKKLEKRLG